MPKTKVRKKTATPGATPKVDRNVLKALLLDYIRPQIMPYAERAAKTSVWNHDLQRYVYVTEPIDESKFQITYLRIFKEPKAYYRYYIKAKYRDESWAELSWRISQEGQLHRY